MVLAARRRTRPGRRRALRARVRQALPILSTTRLYLRAGAGIARRDAIVYLSYRLRFLGQIAAVFLTLALFFYMSRIVSSRTFATPADYFAFVIVGLAIVEVLTATLSTVPTLLRSELMTGTFERLAVTPLGPIGAIVAMTLFPMLLALASSTLLIVLGTVAFGLEISSWTAVLALPTALLGALAFLPFSLMLAALVLMVKQAGSGAAFLVTGLSLVSGAFFPRSLLPGWISWTADVQPLTPSLELLRHELVGSAMTMGVTSALLRLVGFLAVLGPIALLVLAAAIETAREQATLTEY